MSVQISKFFFIFSIITFVTEHKLNLTLANCSLTLMNRSKEVLVVTLTQFLASLETRPSAKAYKVVAHIKNT
jgi:hypothetical protein